MSVVMNTISDITGHQEDASQVRENYVENV